MPALPPAPAVLQLTTEWDVGSDLSAITRTHYLYTGAAPSSTDIVTFLGTYVAATSVFAALALDTESSYLGSALIDLTSPMSGGGEVATSTPGTRTGDVLGAGVAVLVNETITRRYRGGKPKSFVPWGTSTDLLTRQTWQAASLTDFGNYYAEIFRAPFIGQFIGPALITEQVSVSYYGPPNRTVTGSTGRVRTLSTTRATPIIDPVSSVAVSPRVSSQRRRNLRS